MRRGEEKYRDWFGHTIRDIRPQESFIARGSKYHTVLRGQMLDMIAFINYGDESLWYLIADVNEIMDVMQPLESGRRLIIPKVS